MRNSHELDKICGVCGKRFNAHALVSNDLLNEQITAAIRQDHPDWSTESYICRPDLARYRSQYVHSLLESEKGELSNLEQEVLRSLQEHELISQNVDAEFEQQWTLGERLADRIASFGGSWSFLILFTVFITVWIVMNSLVLLWRPADPYPFILLNLMLSCLAAIQAPVIMMSQNRQDKKDRLRGELDYDVNRRAHTEIQGLAHKLNLLGDRLGDVEELLREKHSNE